MSPFRVKTTECRIGIVGQYNAGKTVFLTSLINHLEHHDPERFRLGDGTVTINRFETVPCTEEGWISFNYRGYRDALVHQGRWPEKTRDCSQYCCRFERSDWFFSDALVKFYDLPGERLADAAMFDRSFAEWSDHLLGIIMNDTPYRNACTPFFERISTLLASSSAATESIESELIDSYKLSLARLILNYKPLISPSTFYLDQHGSLAKGNDAESLAASRVLGLSAQKQFLPLPASLRQAFPELTATFAERYNQYVNEIVTPFLKALYACHSLIVLVDILTILAAGVGMYDDNWQMLRDLFEVLNPGENFLMRVGRELSKLLLPHQLRPGWITRVAFVAPKMDLVHPEDRDRLERLLQKMVGKLATDRTGLRYRFFNCAAVVSTVALPIEENRRFLKGIPYRDLKGKKIPPGEPQKFTVSGLPEDWPREWHAGDYFFPEVYPVIPARKSCPPDQLNLDRIFDFVLD